jgi:hypothetical protein
MFVLHGLYVLFFLTSTFIRRSMAGINPDISNGTCYYSGGAEAPSRFIPCGNEASGNKPCCESQDMCLSSNACYNGECECLILLVESDC